MVFLLFLFICEQPFFCLANDSTSIHDITKIKKSSEYTAAESDDSSLTDLDNSDSSITTRIYRSTDNTIDLFNNDKNFNPTYEGDLINKGELINRKTHYSKNVRKITNVQKSNAKDFSLYPWILSIVFISFLIILFSYLKKNRI